jgi:hypothetical protein
VSLEARWACDDIFPSDWLGRLFRVISIARIGRCRNDTLTENAYPKPICPVFN